MTDQANIDRIIERAKQQRAELIGASVRKHPVAALLLVTIPVLLTQIPWSPSATVADATYQNAQSTTRLAMSTSLAPAESVRRRQPHNVAR